MFAKRLFEIGIRGAKRHFHRDKLEASGSASMGEYEKCPMMFLLSNR